MKIYRGGIVNILMYTFPWSCTTAETDGVRCYWVIFLSRIQNAFVLSILLFSLFQAPR